MKAWSFVLVVLSIGLSVPSVMAEENPSVVVKTIKDDDLGTLRIRGEQWKILSLALSASAKNTPVDDPRIHLVSNQQPNQYVLNQPIVNQPKGSPIQEPVVQSPSTLEKPPLPSCRSHMIVPDNWSKEEKDTYRRLPLCRHAYYLPLVGHLETWNWYISFFAKEPRLKNTRFRLHQDRLNIDLPSDFFKDRDEFTFILKKPYTGFEERHTLKKQDATKSMHNPNQDMLTIYVKTKLDTQVFSLEVPELHVDTSSKFYGHFPLMCGVGLTADYKPWND
jgi:hypothetical protein